MLTAIIVLTFMGSQHAIINKSYCSNGLGISLYVCVFPKLEILNFSLFQLIFKS